LLKLYVYNPNVTRTNKSVSIGGAPASVTTCTCDPDNRFISVAEGRDLGSPVHKFAYDYRSRRIYRAVQSIPCG
jgi:hypothetical protein